MRLKITRIFAIVIACAIISGCHRPHDSYNLDGLRSAIDSIAAASPGTVGVAIITPDGDTLTVNNDVKFPLMSVFKLHEAIAAAHVTDRHNQSLDSLLTIRRDEVSPDTWSPMLQDYPRGDFDISIGDLIRYMLLVSDNNASTLIFDRVVSVAHADSIIRTLDVPSSFQLRFTEREMQADHPKSYENWSSPLSCAALIKAVIADSLVSPVKQDSIRSWLSQCSSANGRMASAVAQVPDAKLYHRTGSGYVNDRGQILAVNDIGLIELPDGRQLAVAILIKDYAGTQPQADAEIATLTKIIIEHITYSSS
ncbi:MAG: class A beta-lactamase-related serine hydrolase [Muribaculaceae bacterium]|nr:class A beta-lactamase-related serine hydrolase [Muribaculaceae bacterium]